MAALELCNVRKSYPGSNHDTLKDIDLKIDDGEFLILVGPSGCGKSTLMNCIAGLEEITGGEICRTAGLWKSIPNSSLTPFRHAK